MRPLIGKSTLSEHSGDLSPVSDGMQEDVGCDFVLAGGHLARGHCHESQHAIELTLGSRSQKVDEVSTGIVSQLEDVINRALRKPFPLRDWLVVKALCVTELYLEDV